jgi:hypothetical protein
MKIYEDYSFAGEFDLTSILELKDNGRFLYHETQVCWGGGSEDEVQGIWRQSGDTIFFRAELTGRSTTIMRWEGGREQQAVVQEDDSIKFESNFVLSRRREKPVQSHQPPGSEKGIKPDDTDKKKVQSPSIALLHFKDGNIQEQQLLNNPLYGLIDAWFYKLEDENGNMTNLFKLRQNPKNFDSSVLDYDEIDITPTVKSDELKIEDE